MSNSSSGSRVGIVNTGRVPDPAVPGLDPANAPPPAWGSCRVKGRAEVLRQAFEIQDPAYQVRLLSNSSEAAAAEAPQPVPVLALAEELLDQLPTALRQAIPEPALAHAHARVGRAAPARLRRDMGLDTPGEQRLEEVFVKEPLVGAERGGREAQPPFRPLEERQAAGLLCCAALEDLHPEPEQDAMTVLHHRIDGVARIRARPPRPLGDKPAVGICDRAMGGIAALLPPEIHRAIAGIRRPILRGPVLGPQPPLVLPG